MVENLVAEYADHVEGSLRADGVHEHVSMDADKVL